MTEDFIDHCLDTANQIMTAFGRLIRFDLAKRRLSLD